MGLLREWLLAHDVLNDFSNIEILSPFPEWAWPNAWAWAEHRRDQLADDFFPANLPAFVEQYSVRFRHSRTFGLCKNGVLNGVVIIEPVSPVVATAHILLSKRLWGMPAVILQGVAFAAFESDPELIRIQSFVPAWNRLAIALSVRIGGTVEGVLRGATLRGGRPADAVLIGMTREEFYGTESRRIDGRDVQQLDCEQQPEQHVQPDADRGAERGGINPVAGSGGVKRRRSDTGKHGIADGGGRRDKQDLKRADRKDKPVPRAKGIRQKRADRTDDPAGRTGKRRPDRK